MGSRGVVELVSPIPPKTVPGTVVFTILNARPEPDYLALVP